MGRACPGPGAAATGGRKGGEEGPPRPWSGRRWRRPQAPRGRRGCPSSGTGAAAGPSHAGHRARLGKGPRVGRLGGQPGLGRQRIQDSDLSRGTSLGSLRPAAGGRDGTGRDGTGAGQGAQRAGSGIRAVRTVPPPGKGAGTPAEARVTRGDSETLSAPKDTEGALKGRDHLRPRTTPHRKARTAMGPGS